MLNFLRNTRLILEKIKRLEYHLIYIINLERKIMTTVLELETKITSLVDHVTKESAEASATLKDLNYQITVLRAQVTAGAPATQADLDRLSAALDGIIKAVDNIIPDAPVVVPVPVPVPVPMPVPVPAPVIIGPPVPPVV